MNFLGLADKSQNERDLEPYQDGLLGKLIHLIEFLVGVAFIAFLVYLVLLSFSPPG